MNINEFEDNYKNIITALTTNNDEDIKKLVAEKKKILKPLYKYCAINLEAQNYGYSIANFENDILFFQDPHNFNDPFDALLGIDLSYLYRDFALTVLQYNNVTLTKEHIALIEKITTIIDAFDTDSNKATKLLFEYIESGPGFEYTNIPTDILSKEILSITAILTKNPMFLNNASKILNGRITNKTIFSLEKSLLQFEPLIKYTKENNIEISNLIKDISNGWKIRKQAIKNLPSHGVPWVIVELIYWQLAAIYKWKFPDINNIKEQIDNLLINYPKILKKAISEKYRIACLSEYNDSILMWSHYANKHTGFCLEYDFRKIEFENELWDFILLLFPIIYTNKRIYPPNDFIQQSKFRFYNITQKTNRDINMFLGMLTKSNVWKYEKEWRFICPKEIADKIMMPYVSKVFLGINTPTVIKEKLIAIAKTKRIPVYQMYMDPSSFLLKPDIAFSVDNNL